MSQQAPLISVITLWQGSGEDFLQTRRCLTAQTFPWFEWLILGAPPEVTRAGETNDLQAAHIRFEDPGATPALAEADLVLFLALGDRPAPQHLETLYWGLHFSPDAGWAYTDATFAGSQLAWAQPFAPGILASTPLPPLRAAVRKALLDNKLTLPAAEHAPPLLAALLAQGQAPLHITQNLIECKIPQAPLPQTELPQGPACTEYPPAIEYPAGQKPGSYAAPKAVPFPLCAWPNDGRIHAAFLIPWMVMGGADSFNLSLLAGLDPARFRAAVLTTHPSDNDWQPRFAQATPEIFNLPTFLSPNQYAAFLSAFIQSRGIQLLFISNSDIAYAFIPWLRLQFPQLAIVDYVHASEWRTRGGGYARTAGMYGEVLDKTYVCNADTRREIIEVFGRRPESIETVYIGADETHYQPGPVTRDIRAELGIAAQQPIVLFPCRTAPQKRPMLMMAIARQMAQEGQNAAFVVAGDGPNLEEMQAYAATHQLSNVYFAGRQSDLRPYYSSAALTLICSSFEGLSLTAYESMAMATPVVTSDVGGQSELVCADTGAVVPFLAGITEGPDAGYFLDEEVALYVQAIRSLLAEGDALKERGLRCRSKIEAGFSIRHMLAKMEAEFTRLCTPPACRQREVLAQSLAAFPLLWAELATLQAELMKGDTALEAERQSHAATSARLSAKAHIAEKELERIHAMRSWRVVGLYRRFAEKLRGQKTNSNNEENARE